MHRQVNTIHLVPVAERVPYRVGLEWQRELARARIAGDVREDFVLLLEHEPVVTLGRGARGSNVMASPDVLAEAGVETVEVERGGDVTYHGPGQLVGYPILDLGRWRRDLHWYLRCLEQMLIEALHELGVRSFRYPAYTGVWVGDDSALTDADRAAGRVRKIASLGVHVSRWITWHGFALNVTDEPLRNFDLIVPCGIDEVRMTTLQSEGAIHDWNAVSRAVGRGMAAAFECETRSAPPVRTGDRPVFDSVSAALSPA
jgi:lipoyl(octanoyl) transferase